MHETNIIKQTKAQLVALNCCVVLPTYNNQNTLKRVLDGVLNYTTNIIVVNDGSSDKSQELIEAVCERNEAFNYISFVENRFN